MSKKLINLTGISKSYGDHIVLDDLNLYIRENEFITLLGPSGCGKTTTLRIIGGVWRSAVLRPRMQEALSLTAKISRPCRQTSVT